MTEPNPNTATDQWTLDHLVRPELIGAHAKVFYTKAGMGDAKLRRETGSE
jgi:hypothetical protein